MSDRHALLRRIYAEGWRGLAEHATRDFTSDGEGTGPLRVLFPDIAAEVVELIDAADDRVVARVNVLLGGDRGSLEMVQIWRFRGTRISHVWSLHDALPWLQALGVVPGDEELERRLDALPRTTRPRRSPPA